MRTEPRVAMTLFEVAVSMLLLLVGILTMAMFLPAAIRVQEQARFQVYASAKALDLVDHLMSHQPANDLELEADAPWDTLGGWRSHSPDLEIKAAVNRGSIQPLPLDIAYRIDSEGDEIRRILDEGGYVYYANPAMSHGWRVESPVEPQPPNEAIRLIVGVRGYAQQNAIPHLPWKGWPYYFGYPSPPVTNGNSDIWPSLTAGSSAQSAWSADQIEQNPERRDDPDLQYLWAFDLRKGSASAPDWNWDGSYWSGVRAYDYGSYRVSNSTGRGWLLAKGQLMLALWYAWKKDLPASVILGQATAAEVRAMATNPDWIRAIRFLAHAGICMTRHYALDPQPARPAGSFDNARSGWYNNPLAGAAQSLLETPALDGLKLGVPLPGAEDPALPAGFGRTAPAGLTYLDILALLPAVPNPPVSGSPALTAPAGVATPLADNFYVTHAMIVNWHETCMKAIMAHAARYPYDWACFRPLNRTLMMDFPLMQWDIIPQPGLDPLSGVIAGTASDPNIAAALKPVTASQWRPIAAQDIVNMGHSSTSSAPLNWSALKGDIAHFNLTHRFAAAERGRELVFWMVDWMSWEDCETAPGAPVDASRFPRMRPGTGNSSTWNDVFTTRYMGRSFYDQQYGNVTWDWWEYKQEVTRNPEKGRLFVRSMADVPTGTNVLYWTIGPDSTHDPGHTDNGAFWWRHHINYVPRYLDRPDRGYAPALATHPRDGRPIPDPRMVFSGLYGADRNANQRLDRGPLPTSTRLRAVEIARFNFYDPRLVMSLR